MMLADLREAYFGMMTRSLSDEFLAAVEAENAYFTPEQVRYALNAVRPWFDRHHWRGFEERYPSAIHPRKVGIIMAGNIPLAGLHDLLAVLATGHDAMVKPSHKDRMLITAFVEALPSALRARVSLHDNLSPLQIDYLIASGSGATAVQLEHLFKDTPKLIRKNRFSAAIVTGEEELWDLHALAEDIFLYHGMGCRSVCNIIYPAEWEPVIIADALDGAELPAMHPEWQKAVEWEKALAHMKGMEVIPCNRVLLEVRATLAPARPGVVHLIPNEKGSAAALFRNIKDQIQVTVSMSGPVKLGKAQQPELMDFADGVDTFKVLSELGQQVPNA